MKLFGGLIGWRANKQATVTTSTTEAELLSLAQATKEALFASRLIKELGVTLDSKQLNMWCDNKQTIRLINTEVATLQTRLRHVDIHNHWLRQAVERKQIRVDYTPTGDMLADGLTKALTAEMFKKFREQVGVVDLTDRIETRKLREMKEEDLDALEDLLSGGESDWMPS
ncbi:Reverse transcriptase Ty1/copia-type domain-containing protein [Madurella fahalii]|uniref:Reverse transcriptase Ty1/copia-type domain-containing protein n=1 Tax=Madurella fahalii TaxID=1157608 RepID=A0ABQ0GP50_9PEZI